MNKIKNATATYVRDLNVNDEFMIPGIETIYVCEYRRNGAGTVVYYRVKGGTYTGTFHKPSLSTIYRIEN